MFQNITNITGIEGAQANSKHPIQLWMFLHQKYKFSLKYEVHNPRSEVRMTFEPWLPKKSNYFQQSAEKNKHSVNI